MIALANDHLQLVKLLVKVRGLNLGLKDVEGRSATFYARSDQASALLKALGSHAKIQSRLSSSPSTAQILTPRPISSSPRISRIPQSSLPRMFTSPDKETFQEMLQSQVAATDLPIFQDVQRSPSFSSNDEFETPDLPEQQADGFESRDSYDFRTLCDSLVMGYMRLSVPSRTSLESDHPSFLVLNETSELTSEFVLEYFTLPNGDSDFEILKKVLDIVHRAQEESVNIIKQTAPSAMDLENSDWDRTQKVCDRFLDKYRSLSLRRRSSLAQKEALWRLLYRKDEHAQERELAKYSPEEIEKLMNTVGTPTAIKQSPAFDRVLSDFASPKSTPKSKGDADVDNIIKNEMRAFGGISSLFIANSNTEDLIQDLLGHPDAIVTDLTPIVVSGENEENADDSALSEPESLPDRAGIYSPQSKFPPATMQAINSPLPPYDFNSSAFNVVSNYSQQDSDQIPWSPQSDPIWTPRFTILLDQGFKLSATSNDENHLVATPFDIFDTSSVSPEKKVDNSLHRESISKEQRDHEPSSSGCQWLGSKKGEKEKLTGGVERESLSVSKNITVNLIPQPDPNVPAGHEAAILQSMGTMEGGTTESSSCYGACGAPGDRSCCIS